MSDSKTLTKSDLSALMDKLREQTAALERFASLVVITQPKSDGEQIERTWLLSAIANRAGDLRERIGKCERGIIMIDEQRRTENLGVLFIDGERMT